MNNDKIEGTKYPYTILIYQGSVSIDTLNIIPGMTDKEIGNWAIKQINRAERKAEQDD